eukprot:g14234.t1
MVNPRTPPRNRAAWDDFAVLSGDEDFDTPPGVTRAERPELPASPLSPLSLNMGKTPTGGPGRRPPRNSNKRARSVDIHGHEEEEEEEEEDEDEEAGASDESRVAQAPGALGPGALSHLPTNSPQKAGTRPARETVRRSNRPRPSVRYDGDGGDDDGDDGDWSLAEEESEHEKVGAGPNLNNAARLRLDIPGATKARGLCLGLDAQGDGLAAKLATWIDTDTGAIREGAPFCDRPKFGKDGNLTRRECGWKQDEQGYLVLGVHNSNGKSTNPWCGIGGTVPVVLVGVEWRVAKWALPFIKARKVVQRNTNNQRHGRVPKRKAKT